MSDSALPTRPRRSVLYLPASNEKALAKAKNLAADSLIFDLEDAVLPSAKELARSQLRQALERGGYGQREVVVRINALSTPWGKQDIQLLGGVSVDALLIPKVETAQDIQNAVDELAAASAPVDMPIWAMLETPLGVLNCREIAAHPRLHVLVMGTNDLAKELRIPQTPDRAGFMSSFGQCILAARAYGVDIIDGVYIHIKDEQGLAQVCQQGKELGFDGKSLIHPAQLALTNQIFSPSEEELQEARSILQAWEVAQHEGKGVVQVEGRLVEELHVKEAQRLLQLAKNFSRDSD
jgi:citrate lyase subunit beta/citryl-CoA lyase